MITNYNNRSIHFHSSGSGQTLVLLHGFLESLTIWESFVEELSKELNVITIDLPGFGLSDSFSEKHTMEFMADIVKAVLDHEQINNCMMAGHSMGGYVTLAFANKYPKMLKGLCLFNSQASADSEEAKLNRDRTIKVIEKNRLTFIHNFIPDLFAEKNREKFTSQIEALQKEAANTSKEGIIAALYGMKERKDLLELLSSFNKPVLFIAGKQDKRIPTETVLQQSALPSHCELLLLANVGHMGFIEAKNITMKVLRDFTNRCFEA